MEEIIMKKQFTNRILSLVLTLVMVVGLLPMKLYDILHKLHLRIIQELKDKRKL